MRRHRPSLLALLPTLLLSPLGGCSCGGDVILLDGFDPDSDVEDVLHTYASGGKVNLEVVTVDGFELKQIAKPVIDGPAALDPDEEIERTSTLQFSIRTEEAGTVTVRLVDDAGNDVATPRELVVKDADTIELAVTAPSNAGIELPVVDPTGVHLFAGESAAFRTDLFADDEAIFAHEAVVADSTLSFNRYAIAACAEDTCDVDRAAMEFQAPFGGEPETGTLTSGTASLPLTLIPVTAEEVTDLVLDDGGDFDGKKSVLARVLKDTSPVFGAPVTWKVDDTFLADEENPDFPFEGDVLQYKASTVVRSVDAVLGETTVTIPVSGVDFEVTSITFACGAGPAAAAPLALLVLLGLRRRRRA